MFIDWLAIAWVAVWLGAAEIAMRREGARMTLRHRIVFYPFVTILAWFSLAGRALDACLE